MFGFKKSNQEELSKEEEAKVNEKFNSFKNKAYSEDDMNKVFDNEDNIMKKMTDKHLKQFIDDVKTFFSMLKDYFKGNYKEVPVGTIICIAASLLYVLSPIDIIPDFLPGGLIDDAGVMAACLNFCRIDIEKYREWKKANS